jgi:hypothetical protein
VVFNLRSPAEVARERAPKEVIFFPLIARVTLNMFQMGKGVIFSVSILSLIDTEAVGIVRNTHKLPVTVGSVQKMHLNRLDCQLKNQEAINFIVIVVYVTPGSILVLSKGISIDLFTFTYIQNTIDLLESFYWQKTHDETCNRFNFLNQLDSHGWILSYPSYFKNNGISLYKLSYVSYVITHKSK